MFSLHVELMLVSEEANKKGKKLAGFAINNGFLKEQKAIFSSFPDNVEEVLRCTLVIAQISIVLLAVKGEWMLYILEICNKTSTHLTSLAQSV